MVSMKRTKEEATAGCEVACGSESEYPYGLEIRLDATQLEKLGIGIPPAVGAEMMVIAKVTVTSSSQHQNMGGEAEMSSCWQITDMDVAPVPAKASAMYPNSGMNE